MPDPCDPLRGQIRTLQAERRSLESKLMQPQAILAASLVERFLRAGDSPRHSPAYYLSRSEQGRSKLTYVKKEELDAVRRQCAAYRTFQQNLRAWRRVTAALQQRWKQLQQAQSR
jgi:hypothetical protein